METRKDRDLRVTFPPINEPPIGQPKKPVDPGEPPPRSGQKCANCNAFAIAPHPVFGNQTMCVANPPEPVFLGFQQSKVIDPETGQPRPYPMVVGFQPPTDPEKWCRCWQWVGTKDSE